MTIEYEVVIARGKYELQEMVQRMLRDGWAPLGGVSISYPTTFIDPGMATATFAQALTRSRRPFWVFSILRATAKLEAAQ